MIASMPSLVAADFVAAKVSYGAIAPMLIVFGAALVGVLVEAFAPRAAPLRPPGGPDAWSPCVGGARRRGAGQPQPPGQHRWTGAVVIDGPALFLQGTVLVLSHPGRAHDGRAVRRRRPGRLHPAGRRPCPGSAQEALALRAGAATTEVFPLTLFAVGGMMLFPAAGDLLVMFVALEVLSLPLYILSRPGPPPPAAVAGGVAEVLPARRLLLGVLPLRRGPALRLRRLDELLRPSRRRSRTQSGMDGAAAAGRGAGLGRPAVQGRRGAVPLLDPGRLPGRAHPGHRLHGRLHQGRRVRGDAAAVLRRRRRQPLGLAAGAVGRGDPDHGGRLGAHHHPDRHQAPAGLLLDRARRASSSSASWPSTGSGCPRCCSTWRPTASPSSPRSPWSPWCATAASRGHAPVAVGRPGQAQPPRRRHHGVPAAGLRRHPADLRLHRQVRRVRGRGRARRCLAGGRRRARQLDRRVRLRPGHRADVLLRAGRRAPPTSWRPRWSPRWR